MKIVLMRRMKIVKQNDGSKKFSLFKIDLESWYRIENV